MSKKQSVLDPAVASLITGGEERKKRRRQTPAQREKAEKDKARSRAIYDLPERVKDAVRFSREKGPAVIIARHPCLLDRRSTVHCEPVPVVITDDCDGCGYCIQHFECPALALDEDEAHVQIDTMLCTQCGVCVSVCPKGSIQKGS